MGLIGILKSFVRATRNGVPVSDVKIDVGGGHIKTVEHFQPSNLDCHPLPNDFTATVSQPQAGRQAAVGYLDPVNNSVSQLGEARVYARDASTGETVVELYLKNDGTATLFNSSGSITLQPNGTVNINGVTIDAAGDVTIPDSLVLDGRELNNHTHAQGPDSAGDTQQNTGPNL